MDTQWCGSILLPHKIILQYPILEEQR